MAERPRAVGKVWIVRHDPQQQGAAIFFPNRAFRRAQRGRRRIPQAGVGPNGHKVIRWVKTRRQATPPAIYQPFTWAEHGHLLEGGVNL